MRNGVIAGFYRKIQRFFTQGNQRSVKLKKHISASLFIKGGNILIGFLIVPLTIGYVSSEQYGIWLTLTSVVAWFNFFDIGLGNGLRNKFAESVAKGDHVAAQAFVSTTYALLTMVSFAMLTIFWIANSFIKWEIVLNAPGLGEELSSVALIVFSFFCLTFILKLINTLIQANQRPSLVGFINFLTNIISLGIIFILTKLTQGNLIYLSLALSLSPVLIFSIATLYFFKNDFKAYRPSINKVDFSYVKDIFGLGWQFFIIQIVGIIIFSTDNMIITQLYGPQQVTPYNIAFKYFGIITKVFTIISTPFWSAYTDAFFKNEIKWILKANKSLVRIWMTMVIVGIFLLIVSNHFYHFWVPEVEVPFILSIMMCIYVIYHAWGIPFVIFINGVGRIRLQLIFSIIGGVLNIPLSIFLAKYVEMGTAGVILATSICISYGPIIGPIQFKKIINQKAKGVWNK